MKKASRNLAAKLERIPLSKARIKSTTVSILLRYITEMNLDEQKLKKVLKKSSGKDFLTAQSTSELVGLDENEALQFLGQLEAFGYLEQVDYLENNWTISMRGRVEMARKQKRTFKASTIKAQLQKLIERAALVNKSTSYNHYVMKMKLKEAFPTQSTSAGVSLLFTLESRPITDNERRERTDELRQQANRRFDNSTQYFTYPQVAIRDFLKSKSHILQLEQVTDEELQNAEGQIIYEFIDSREMSSE